MKCFVTLIPGGYKEVEVPEGCSVQDAINLAFPGGGLEEFAVSYAGNTYSFAETADLEITEGRITAATSIVGEAPMPKIRHAHKFLTDIGYVSVRGKGDHVKYKKANSPTIVMNSSKRDTSTMDIASAKQLANVLEVALHDLNAVIQGGAETDQTEQALRVRAQPLQG